jgi:hypothetical protein
MCIPLPIRKKAPHGAFPRRARQPTPARRDDAIIFFDTLLSACSLSTAIRSPVFSRFGRQ